ncbi:MAG: hypothetical protein NC307_12135 [Roseburia sp.]|nr:hypothetical protein [Roseburia sp.]
MRNLQLIYNQCINELISIGIPIQKDKIKEILAVPLHEDGGYGHCSITDNGQYRIEVWDKLLEDNVSLKILKKIVCHELLHTCPDCMNHRGQFRRYARKVDKKYDYQLMVYEDGISLEKPILNKLQCPKCKCILHIRDDERSKSINSLKMISIGLLPQCPFCRYRMVEILTE